MKYIKNKTVQIIAISILGYIVSYGLCRYINLYVHYTGSYRDGVRHTVYAVRAAPIITVPAMCLLYLHYPLKISEEIYWNRNRLASYFNNGLH